MPGAGLTFSATREASLDDAITRFVERGPELQRAAAVRASSVRTTRDHFAELFSLYEQLSPTLQRALVHASPIDAEAIPRAALAMSATQTR